MRGGWRSDAEALRACGYRRFSTRVLMDWRASLWVASPFMHENDQLRLNTFLLDGVFFFFLRYFLSRE